ncbi:MAG: hypothetical protein ACK5MZ_05895 [Aestuariibaculum sp.]
MGIRKSYLLKKENKKLDEIGKKLSKMDTETYTDFTEGHIYEKNNKN